MVSDATVSWFLSLLSITIACYQFVSLLLTQVEKEMQVRYNENKLLHFYLHVFIESAAFSTVGIFDSCFYSFHIKSFPIYIETGMQFTNL